MEPCAGSILAHDPGVRVAYLFDGVGGQAHQLRVPLSRCVVPLRFILPRHALAQLHQGMLNVTGMLAVLQIFGELVVGKTASKPCTPPEKKGHQADEPSRGEEQKPLRGRHAALGFGGRNFLILRGRDFFGRLGMNGQLIHG